MAAHTDEYVKEAFVLHQKLDTLVHLLLVFEVTAMTHTRCSFSKMTCYHD